jgi:hypothetical protein
MTSGPVMRERNPERVIASAAKQSHGFGLLVGPSRAERGIAGQIPPYPPLLKGGLGA